MGRLYIGNQKVTPLIYDRKENFGPTREVSDHGVYRQPSDSFTFSLPSNATDLGERALYYAFYGCPGLTSVDLSSLVTISGQYGLSYAFRNCNNMTTVNLSHLTTIVANYAMQYAFTACSKLTSVDLSALSSITGNYAMQQVFSSCSSLTSMTFSSLATLNGGAIFDRAFGFCSSLTTVSFPALLSTGFVGTAKNQFSSMLYACSNVTVHFTAESQSKIETLTGYPNFGGTNTTVLFDL